VNRLTNVHSTLYEHHVTEGAQTSHTSAEPTFLYISTVRQNRQE